jgi:ornithine cyclodeaminase
MPALCLNARDVHELVDPLELIDAMEAALADFSAGSVVQPVRTTIELDEGSYFLAMPAFVRSPAVHGAKLLTLIPGNAARGLPTHVATIALMDPASGALIALVDGAAITELRTAAVSAVSARYLARPDASRLAILGTGVQARGHLAFLPLVCEFSHIAVWGRRADRARALASTAGRPVDVAASAQEAVRDADVVVLVTASPVPMIEDAWVRPGTHVISVGACRPTEREMDPALVARAHLVVDSRAAALAESGDVLQGIREGRFGEDHLRAELGHVVSGRSGRPSDQSVTIFKSLGMAVEDLVAAHLAWRRARERGRGVEAEIG